jgi:hypothetical protein
LSKKVVVIGAGWAGLNAARILNEAGCSVKVLEKSNRVGGRITSDYIDGFILDRGFQVINPKYAELRETKIMENVDFKLLPKGLDVRAGRETIRVGDFRKDLRYLKGNLDSSLGSLNEKIAFLRYLQMKSEDISFGDAMVDVGAFYTKVLKPFLDGVFLVDSSSVSNRMARELIHWFIKGSPGVPSAGVREVSEGLAAGIDIEFDTEVLSISSDQVITSAGRESFDAVILAADPISATQLLGEVPVRMNASQTWYFKVPKGEISSDHLRVGGVGPIVNTVALSNIAPSYAPSDSTLVSATNIGSAVEGEIRSHLGYLWDLETNSWDLIAKYDIPYSLPLHGAGKPLVSHALSEKGVYLAGDWRATPSQQGALLSGRLAALAVISQL